MKEKKQLTEKDNEMLEKLKHGTSYDRIYGHYVYPGYIELTEKEVELRDRWAFAWTALLNHRLTGTAVNMIKEEYEVSEPQAFRDIKNARRLFGDVNETTKQAGMAPSVPDGSAIDKAAEYNNFQKAGGSYGQNQGVTNNYITNNNAGESTRQMAEDMKELKEYMKDPQNRRAVISNDVMQEHEEEQKILNELNNM